MGAENIFVSTRQTAASHLTVNEVTAWAQRESDLDGLERYLVRDEFGDVWFTTSRLASDHLKSLETIRPKPGVVWSSRLGRPQDEPN